MRLNVLCAFFAVVQIAIGLSLFLVTLSGVNMTNENLEDEMEDP
jgi:capsular polysaccharide biosynthesis protein